MDGIIAMPRVYDGMYDDAARAERYIEQAYNEGKTREVMQHIDTLYNASNDFMTLAVDWNELAQKYENILVEKGVL
jgi:hypothetical protein